MCPSLGILLSHTLGGERVEKGWKGTSATLTMPIDCLGCTATILPTKVGVGLTGQESNSLPPMTGAGVKPAQEAS